jgi:adenine-specific DNA-methyltransferase
LFAATTDDGEILEDDAAARLLTLPGVEVPLAANLQAPPELAERTSHQQQSIQRHISQRNAGLFEAEVEKLDAWADDLKLGLEREIKELDRQIKDARRAATTALSLEEKLAGQKQIKTLESQRNDKRRSLFEAQDRVDLQRELLISSIENKLAQQTSHGQIFTIRWKLS